MNRNPHAAFGLFLAALLMAALGCSGKEEPETPQTAPGFTLAALEGDPVRLSDYRGKVVLLDFWATWCAPCRVSIPHLMELQNRYREDGFTVIGMNMDHDGEDLAAFLRQLTINYPIVKVTEDVRAAYGGVSSIPVAFLVDRRGLLRRRFLGYDNRVARDMEQAIQTLLGETH